MATAKITEIIASSSKSFDDAIASGLKRAGKTLKGIQSAWIADQEVLVKGDRISEYRVRMKVTFVLK
jgi:hypothetical protein